MICLWKTHEASLNAIVLQSLHTFHTMALDLVLGFLCNVSNTLIKRNSWSGMPGIETR